MYYSALTRLSSRVRYKPRCKVKYKKRIMTHQPAPFYFRFTMVLFMLGLLCAFIYLGHDILIPISFAFLFAILLLPVVNFFERKLGKAVSIILALLISFILVGGLAWFIGSQVAGFTDDLPAIKKQMQEQYHSLQLWVRQQFNMPVKEQDKLVTQAKEQLSSSGSGLAGQTFAGITGTLVVFVLLPVYTFLLLFYRDMLRRFMIAVFPKKNEPLVKEVLDETKVIVNSYMVGLIIEMLIVATINSAGFLIAGVNYAVFLGVFAAVLNLIPYIGMLIATIFCAFIALSGPDGGSQSVIWVVVILVVVQFIDNNIIMPKVVSSKVKINAMASIIGVVIGGTLAGVAGMFLSIPAIALLKTIFERIDETKPWALLLGDDNNQQPLRIKNRKKTK
jgi:predicted PurR-regulated permease PerM